VPSSSPLVAETFVVARQTAIPVAANVGIFSNGGNRYTVCIATGGQGMDMLSQGPTIGNGYVYAENQDFIYDSIWNTAASTGQLNGRTPVGGSSMTGAASTFAVGNNAASGISSSWGGFVYEIIFYNRQLITGERNAVLKYIGNRYNLYVGNI
jgi:hypothetical protein